MAAPRRLSACTYIFSGRVQGVGFRYTAVQFARGLALAGTVRNLPDGRVELVLEGAPAAREELVTRLREHFAGLVRNVEQSDGVAAGLPQGIHVIG